MAAHLPSPRYCIQNEVVPTTNGWYLLDLSLSSNGSIAVARYNENTNQTYIEVYTSIRNCDLRDEPTLVYSNQFEKNITSETRYRWRYVSFIDICGDDRSLVIVTCCRDTIELIDVVQNKIIKSHKVKFAAYGDWFGPFSISGKKEIFVRRLGSNQIDVYNALDLTKIRSFALQGSPNGYYIYDLTAIGEKIFVTFISGSEMYSTKAMVFEEKNGMVLSELTPPSDRATWGAASITFNKILNVIAVAWSSGITSTENVIAFYSLSSEDICMFSLFENKFGVNKIRISDRGDKIVWINEIENQIKAFDLGDMFSYDYLKETLKQGIVQDDCLKLTDFFTLPGDKKDAILKSETPTEKLLPALEEEGIIDPLDVEKLVEAFTSLQITSSCSYLVDFYQKLRMPEFYKETIRKLQREINGYKENDCMHRKLEKEHEVHVFNIQQEVQRLEEENKENEQHLQQIKDLYEKAISDQNKFKTERDRCKSKLSIVEKNLGSARKDLRQTKELLRKSIEEKNEMEADLNKLRNLKGDHGGDKVGKTAQARPGEEVSSQKSMSSATSGYLQETAIPREFAKLLVKVSVKLTYDQCILLATYFDFPESKVDLIRQNSGTPGITLLNIMKERHLINMYDVKNLQQALKDVEFHVINAALLKPYQEQIDPLLYERHKTSPYT